MIINSKIFNAGLRSLSIILKFGLTFLILKYSDDNVLGEFSLLGSSIIILYTLLGLDFYSYSTREFINRSNLDQMKILSSHLYLILVSYIIAAPFLYFFADWYLNFSPFLFILLLLLEHINQELFRILININKQLSANWVFFLRNGVWVILFFLHVQFYNIDQINLIKTIVYYWIFGEFLALSLALVFIKHHYQKLVAMQVDIKWLVNGIKVCFWFFLSTIFQNLTIYINRFIIDSIEGKTDLGIFSFFFQLANMLNVFVFTVVVIYYYPKLLELFKNGHLTQYLKLRKEFLKQIVIYSTISFILLLVIIFPATYLLNKKYYLSSIDTYVFLLLANIVFNISLIWHYNIYNMKKDLILFLISLIGFVINFALTIFLVKIIGITGAALSALISAIVVLILKLYVSSKLDSRYGIH